MGLFWCWEHENQNEEDGWEIAAYDAESAASEYHEHSDRRRGEMSQEMVVFVREIIDGKRGPALFFASEMRLEPAYYATRKRARKCPGCRKAHLSSLRANAPSLCDSCASKARAAAFRATQS